MTLKRSSILATLSIDVAVRMTSIVLACFKSDPNRATFLPSTLIKEGTSFKVKTTLVPQFGI
jgi:hypothetical protein